MKLIENEEEKKLKGDPINFSDLDIGEVFRCLEKGDENIYWMKVYSIYIPGRARTDKNEIANAVCIYGNNEGKSQKINEDEIVGTFDDVAIRLGEMTEIKEK